MAKNPGQLQLAFNKTAEKKNRQIHLKAQYRELLEDQPGWTKLMEELEALTYKKKQILQTVSDANPKLVDELQALGIDIKTDKELLADLALKNYIEEGKCEVADDDGNVYYPVFSVSFKKNKDAGGEAEEQA